MKAIESGWLQGRIARRALERKRATDAGTRVVVGQNRYRREDQTDSYGEVFRLDPEIANKVLEKLAKVKQTRDPAAAAKALDRLAQAAASESENLMPWLVDCCHAYVTVGEMVTRLKSLWGEFQEPVNL